MSYQKTSIREIIKDIEGSKVYLPALQRKFVWDKHRIQLLFDSLMRNFPIGTFLFWKLNREKANTYVFYEFLKEYDSRSPFNRKKTGSFLHEDVIGVLDGQQRLSSLYIGLQGTHTEKAPYKRQHTADAFPKTQLYLNLLSLPYYIDENNKILTNEEQNFEFVFLKESDSIHWNRRKVWVENELGEIVEKEDHMYWFKVGDVLSWSDDPEFDIIMDEFQEKAVTDEQKKALKTKRRLVRKSLETLRERMKEQLINYFEVDKEDLEDILKIFVRVNSGGLQLNKTDLLFSTIVASWSEGREQIEDLLKEINKKGDGFNFTNEYLMRCCLVVTDLPVQFKVQTFGSDGVERIKQAWEGIKSAVAKMVELLTEFGFNAYTLTSQNATFIIVYYILKGGLINQETKKEIKKYLIHSLLTGVYGTSQDQFITTLRNAFREEIKDEVGKKVFRLKHNPFSFEELLKLDLPSRKSFYISEQELDKFLEYKKGSGAFLVLSLLYPDLRYKDVSFHQDHIHPFSQFNYNVLTKLGIPYAEHQYWYNYRDMVPNLQLLEGRQNESKNATPFAEWLGKKTPSEQLHFTQANFIPSENGFEFRFFIEDFEERRNLLKNKLWEVLAISKEQPAIVPESEALYDEEEMNDMPDNNY